MNDTWLLEPHTEQKIREAFEANLISVEEETKFVTQQLGAFSGETPRIMSVAGSNAEIAIKGTLTKAPNFLAMIFGGGNTTYPEIITALAAAEQDDSVTDIILDIDSPGGQFDGLFDALDAIQRTKKPVTAKISNLGASAAYAIAAQADSITAVNSAARIGSIGIAATFRVSENEVTITSTRAPKKRPDVTTKQGQEMVKETLDSLHDLFVEAIADGRGTTVENINTNFGQGATLLSREALKRGMIDSIENEGPIGLVPPLKEKAKEETVIVADSKSHKIQKEDEKKQGKKNSKSTEVKDMDLKKLQSEHRDIYDAAVTAGVEKERDRVKAHLVMGEASGDMATAITAVNDGTEMTTVMQSTYMAAGMNRKDVETKGADDKTTEEALSGAGNGTEEPTTADEVAALVEEKSGITLGGEA